MSNELLSVTVDRPTNPELFNGGALADMVSSLVVEDQGSYELASGYLKDAKGKLKVIEKEEDERLRPIRDGLAGLRDFFKKLKAPLERAETDIKAKMSDYYDKEQRRIADDQRQRQAAIDADLKRQQNDAIRREADALEKGDEEAARQAREDFNAPPPMAIATAAPKPKAAGTSAKQLWKHEVNDLPELINAVAEGRAPVVCIMANDAVIGQLARAQKEHCKIPGVRVWPVTNIGSTS